MTAEEKTYEGKYFYEIVKVKSGRNAGTIQLFGPFDNIYYIDDYSCSHISNVLDTGECLNQKFKYAQIINGNPVQLFTEKEILITDRKL